MAILRVGARVPMPWRRFAHRRSTPRRLMPEHDDDLESVVHEDAEEETDTFPNTDDELDNGADDDEDGEPQLDQDESEL